MIMIKSKKVRFFLATFFLVIWGEVQLHSFIISCTILKKNVGGRVKYVCLLGDIHPKKKDRKITSAVIKDVEVFNWFMRELSRLGVRSNIICELYRSEVDDWNIMASFIESHPDKINLMHHFLRILYSWRFRWISDDSFEVGSMRFTFGKDKVFNIVQSLYDFIYHFLHILLIFVVTENPIIFEALPDNSSRVSANDIKNGISMMNVKMLSIWKNIIKIEPYLAGYMQEQYRQCCCNASLIKSFQNLFDGCCMDSGIKAELISKFLHADKDKFISDLNSFEEEFIRCKFIDLCFIYRILASQQDFDFTILVSGRAHTRASNDALLEAGYEEVVHYGYPMASDCGGVENGLRAHDGFPLRDSLREFLALISS